MLSKTSSIQKKLDDLLLSHDSFVHNIILSNTYKVHLHGGVHEPSRYFQLIYGAPHFFRCVKFGLDVNVMTNYPSSLNCLQFAGTLKGSQREKKKFAERNV